MQRWVGEDFEKVLRESELKQKPGSFYDNAQDLKRQTIRIMKRLNSALRLLPVICIGVLLLSCNQQYQDQDGNLLTSVKIGKQEWMAKNLEVVTFRNGDSIPIAETKEEWEKAAAEGRPVYCIYYKNHGDNSGTGKLYNWYAFNDSRMLAPKGWHIPSDKEWIELSLELGMSPSEADKLHERGTDE